MGVRRMGAIAVVAAAALLLGACAQDPAPQGPADSVASKSPGGASDNGVQHSPNARLVANVPLSAPFDGEQAWGTDLAFRGDHAYVGNYEGFTIHDISDPTHPKVITRVVCPGGQNDISVSGNLVFLSVDEPRSDETCESQRGDSISGWEGIRIFDVSDPAKPRYLKSIATQCGSHTHTLVPGKDASTVYLYVSSFGPAPDTAKCKPPHDSIAIVEVPVNDPGKAAVVAQPVLFEDGADESQPGATSGCHDITVYPEKDLAAGACLGNGILMDISDRAQPKVLKQVTDAQNFSIWHSATFSNDASRVIFSDELGGGQAPTCDPKAGANKGADAVYDIVDGRDLRRTGAYFKIPRTQTGAENCVAHNGSLLPVPGKTIMVQAWYQGGVSVVDYTDPAAPKEIAYVDRGPIGSTGEPRLGGSWSAYYYNGYVYSSDITKGLDVIAIDDPLTDPAKQVRVDEFNAQTQVAYPE
ncbi:hypothetical protein ABGB17_08670 [Sphaerisporangium sp. B11E5]|uniref:LVIVD repeat-containing protein n=1 Tax=Sphaerisporangium sp. B11E5 TaxID=3153563 RepID=UPI00325E70CA